MSASVRFTLVAFFLAAVASAQNVSLTWIGQSCFYIQTAGGPTVVTDPPAPSVGYTLPGAAADVVTISHNHTDHNNSAGVPPGFTLVDGRPVTARSQTDAAGLSFVLIPGFHDNTNGATRGPNTIVRWTQGGINFVHFGDYGQDSLTEAQLADLKDIDVLMVPGGGFFTVDGSQMAKIIEQLKPRVAILMHYRTALGGPAQLAALPAVTSPFPLIRYKPAAVTINKAALPSQTEVWLMEPAAPAYVVNPAGFTRGEPVSPSGLATAFGTFTGSATMSYSSTPLPRKLGETELLIGGDAAPVLYVSPTQINFQTPGALAPGQNVFEVRVGGQRIAQGSITTVDRAPGIFAAIDQGGRLGRVRRGESVTIYASGQGAVSPAVPDGAVAPGDPPSTTKEKPTVLLDGRPVAVTTSALAPGYVGLWVIQAQIPADATPGSDLDLVVQFEPNLASNAIKITVE